jgi:hypothetical protein
MHSDCCEVSSEGKKVRWSRGRAVLLSLMMPGAGQLYSGKTLAGLIWLPAVVLGYFASPLLGIAAHSVCVIDATDRKLETPFGDPPEVRISRYGAIAFGALSALLIFICVTVLVS